MQDLRLAVRALRATPVVTAVAILSLGLGIGANTAIFSLVDSLVLRSLQVKDPERLAVLPGSGGVFGRFAYSYATFDQFRQNGRAFDGALAYSCCGKATLTLGGENQTVDRMWVSGDFFATLGVSALLGRTLSPADDVAGGGPNGPVAVISYRLWQQRFGGDARVIGTPVTIERIPVTVVGVAPPEFFGVEVGRTVDVILPVRTEPLILPAIPFDDHTPFLAIMLRLKPEQSVTAATAALRAVQPQIRAGSLPPDPAIHAGDFLRAPFTLVPAGTGISTLRQQFQRPLIAILIVVGFVLVIACANIANLMLARGAARRYQLTMQLALGASRWRLVRQLLTESVVVAVIGTMVALAFATWGSRAIVAQLSNGVTPVVLDLSVDWRIGVFTAVTLIGTTLLFGMIPALYVTRVEPIEVLKEHGRMPAHGSRLPNGLVVAQIAVSVLLVVAAGLFIRTFDHLASLSLGFDHAHILVVTVTAPTVPASDRNQFYHRLVRAAAITPGVFHAGGSLDPPPLFPPMADQLLVTVPGAEPRSTVDRTSRSRVITPGWLGSYGMSVSAGRDIDERDTPSTRPVMIVNEAFVRQFFRNAEAVGETVTLTLRAPFGEISVGPKTIVGIVGDAVFTSIREPAPPTMYLPLAQRDSPILNTNFYLSVRASAGSPLLLTRELAGALTAINRDLTLTFRPLDDQVRASLDQERLVAVLSGFFGVLALLLAGLGLYGVTSYAVVRRRSEIGIRMALGAAPADVIGLVLTRVGLLVGMGVLIGGGISLWASTFVASLLYGLEPRDPATLIGAAVTLTAVGAVAGWLPAWRASRIDPAEALRES